MPNQISLSRILAQKHYLALIRFATESSSLEALASIQCNNTHAENLKPACRQITFFSATIVSRMFCLNHQSKVLLVPMLLVRVLTLFFFVTLLQPTICGHGAWIRYCNKNIVSYFVWVACAASVLESSFDTLDPMRKRTCKYIQSPGRLFEQV